LGLLVAAAAMCSFKMKNAKLKMIIASSGAECVAGFSFSICHF
jgi:hypothetical protein